MTSNKKKHSSKLTSKKSDAKQSGYRDYNKSVLAKLLADEDICFRHSSHSTAYFDTKTRTLVLPNWSNIISEDLYDMLIIHEVGHALFTPVNWTNDIENTFYRLFNVQYDKMDNTHLNKFSIIHSIYNIVEDSRIDKLQQIKYPGSKSNYYFGYKELLNSGFFGNISTSRLDLIKKPFPDRYNLYFKIGNFVNIPFTKFEETLIDRGKSIVKWKDVVQLSNDIADYHFNQSKKISLQGDDYYRDILNDIIKNIQKDSNKSSNDPIFAPNTIVSDKSKNDSDPDNNEKGYVSGFGPNGKPEKDHDSEKDRDPLEGIMGREYDITDNIMDIDTYNDYQKNLTNLVSTDHIIYANLPISINMDRVVVDYKKFLSSITAIVGPKDNHYIQNIAYPNFTFLRNELKTSISYMVTEFERKKASDTYAKTMIGATGVLNPNKLHSYKYSNELFKTNEIVPAGKNHGFFIVLDWSGSMKLNLKHTMKQLFSIVLFCKSINIPFEVYIFLGANGNRKSLFNYSANNLEGFELSFDSFKMVNILSSKMTLREFNTACVYLHGLSDRVTSVYPMSSTPLNEAIIATKFLAKKFKNDNKIQCLNIVFLTDGDGDSVGVDKHTVLQDTLIKKDYSCDSKYATPTLLKNLKDYVDCNIVGFYFKTGYTDSQKIHMDDSNAIEKYTEISYSSGYDEYYIISTSIFRLNEDVALNEKCLKINADEIEKEKYYNDYLSNRLQTKKAELFILNKFISQITRNI